jgi:two-component system, NarL family, invasion response regulator UvrY
LIKVLIVDDHALVRMGIKRLLEDIHDIEVIAEAQNGEEALTMVQVYLPDVILLDMKMPGMDGWEVIRRLKNSSVTSKIIAVSALSAGPLLTRVMQLGAMGYLSKESSIDEMTGAIRKVHQGERYLSAQLAQQLAINSLDSVSETPFQELSEREMQVMLMITSGLTVSEISTRLFLSTKTINCYRYRIFAKLNVKNDVELTHLAIKHSIIERPDEAKH